MLTPGYRRERTLTIRVVVRQDRPGAVAHRPHDVAGKAVGHEHGEEDERGARGDDGEADHQGEDHPQRHALFPVYFLEAPERHVRDHRYAGEDRHAPGDWREPLVRSEEHT